MPGKRITHQQRKVYMTLRKTGLKQTICAAKAGFSPRSGRNVEHKSILSSESQKKVTKRHNDPLTEVWQTTLVPLLEQMPYLTSWTLLEHLQDQYPGQYPDSILRTVQLRASKELLSNFVYDIN